MATTVAVDETEYGGWLVANAGEWLPRAVAAVRLGISDRTLARRIASGALPKRVTNGTTEVYVTDAAQQQETDQGVIRILVQRNQELAEQLGKVKEEKRNAEGSATLWKRRCEDLQRELENWKAHLAAEHGCPAAVFFKEQNEFLDDYAGEMAGTHLSN